MNHRSRRSVVLFSLLVTGILSACGGGGGSDSGILVEGTLTEAGGAAHQRITPKHSDGARIEGVQICAFDECSTTDEQGQWGFVAPEQAAGSNAVFTFRGHGLDTVTTVSIPTGISEIVLDFRHVAGGAVEVRK